MARNSSDGSIIHSELMNLIVDTVFVAGVAIGYFVAGLSFQFVVVTSLIYIIIQLM